MLHKLNATRKRIERFVEQAFLANGVETPDYRVVLYYAVQGHDLAQDDEGRFYLYCGNDSNDWLDVPYFTKERHDEWVRTFELEGL